MQRSHVILRSGIVVLVLAMLALAVPAFAQGGDTRVSVGSPATPFSQNKQNEPAVAINAGNPLVVAAGANDQIDIEACDVDDPTTCPFNPGVGLAGIYFSFDGGHTWTQPTYTGWTARDCLGPASCSPHVGPIGTLPKYYENGLVANGDPSLAFGPRPGSNGTFSWANGSRLYYATLTSNFDAFRSEQTFKGAVAITVARTDDPQAAAAGDNNAWMDPVIVSRQNSALFSDKDQIWADNAASSPFFGYVYVCNVAYRSRGHGGAPEPVMFIRSTDGGNTWDGQQQLSPAVDNSQIGERQGCAIRTDSRGTVYVFWIGTEVQTGQNVLFMTRSFDGGAGFERPRVVASVEPVGLPDFDGILGARTDSFPSVDIANGAPTGADATDEIVMTWPNGPTPSDTDPGSNEQALVQYSLNRGLSWTLAGNAAPPSDRPDFPAIAISPNGHDVYLTYDNFLQPWQSSVLGPPRLMQGVVRHADIGAGGAPGTWTDLHRAATGDARGSSGNGLVAEFLGDYNYTAATNSFAVALWNDVRDAADCPAVDAWRQSLIDGSPTAPPAPNSDCPATFGNSDIFGGSYADPTP